MEIQTICLLILVSVVAFFLGRLSLSYRDKKVLINPQLDEEEKELLRRSIVTRAARNKKFVLKFVKDNFEFEEKEGLTFLDACDQVYNWMYKENNSKSPDVTSIFKSKK